METQESVSAWAEKTFGPAGSNLRVAARVNEELAELLRAVSADDREKALDEAADVVIVAYRLGHRLGVDLDVFFPEPEELLPREQLSARRCAVEANRGMSALLWILENEDVPATRSFVWYCRQVVRHMGILAHAVGGDLRTAIADKMAVNRQREWKVDGTGHGYHVRHPSERSDPSIQIKGS